MKELLNKPLRRSFGLPRDITLLENGWALNIMTPPVKPGDGGNLSVVALVLKPPPEYVQEDLPPAMSQRLYEQVDCAPNQPARARVGCVC